MLQLENYEILRYLKLLFKKGYFFSNQPLRSQLVWTVKARLILVLTNLFWILTVAFFLWKTNFFVALIWLIFYFLALPFFYSFFLILLWPLEFATKQYLISKAKKIISKDKNLKIIGIAGSYGKTTMKNVLEAVLSTKLKILATPKSVNTPIGIAQWIIKNNKEKPDILIVEIGEHYKGDVEYICKIVPPDVAILTGINEAHIERLKNIENTISTMFEIVQNAKEKALLLFNADDGNIKNSYQKYATGEDIHFYSYLNDGLADIKIKEKEFLANELCWQFSIDEFEKIKVSFLGEYILGDIIASIIIAKNFSLTIEQIKQGIFNIKPVEHRLQPIKGQGDVLVIDDSYNSNPDGVEEAIKILSKFQDRRKIFITPGIVETGNNTAIIHEKIGQSLAKVADVVILVKNSATPFIAKGLKNGGFSEEKIIWFETAQKAHESLGSILKPRDVILFQNDWGDQYI